MNCYKKADVITESQKDIELFFRFSVFHHFLMKTFVIFFLFSIFWHFFVNFTSLRFKLENSNIFKLKIKIRVFTSRMTLFLILTCRILDYKSSGLLTCWTLFFEKSLPVIMTYIHYLLGLFLWS